MESLSGLPHLYRSWDVESDRIESTRLSPCHVRRLLALAFVAHCLVLPLMPHTPFLVSLDMYYYYHLYEWMNCLLLFSFVWFVSSVIY